MVTADFRETTSGPPWGPGRLAGGLGHGRLQRL